MKLKVENISFSFDEKQILKDVNFDVEEGEFITILGHSGCGKSTLLNIIAGILENKAGKIFVDDCEVKGITERFSYMPQDDLLLPWKTVLENISLWDKIHKPKGNNKLNVERKIKLIEEFGLKGYENKFPRHLSGGMKQRVAFLRTALCNTDIWLLDEPFGALDVMTRQQMQDWLLEIKQKINKTMILVTHDIDEAIYLSDRIFILGGNGGIILKEIKIKDTMKSRIQLAENIHIKDEIYKTLQNNM